MNREAVAELLDEVAKDLDVLSLDLTRLKCVLLTEPIEPEPEQRAQRRYRRFEDACVAFRDWVRTTEEPFRAIPEVHEAIGGSEQLAYRIVNWAVGRPDFVVEVDPRERTGRAGRPARWFRYVRPGEVPPARRVVRAAAQGMIPKPRRSGGAPTGNRMKVNDPQVRALVRAAERDPRFSVTKSGSGHIKVAGPGGQVTIAQTPSDHRTALNDRARLRRIGLSA